MDKIHSFLNTFYKAFQSKNSTVLKKLYFTTFETELKLDDIECDEADNSCLFDELYDEFVIRVRKEIQDIWWIIYCDVLGWFLITFDESDWTYLINWEVLEEDINEATGYFYDLFS